MKKTLALFLALTFLFTLAACGIFPPRPTEPGTDASTSDGTTDGTTGAPDKPASIRNSSVETDLSGYTLTVQPMDHERDGEPAFEGLHLGVPTEYDTDDVRLNLTLQQKGGEAVFSILVRDAYPSFYVQAGNPITCELHAKNGNRWLFSIRGNLGEDQDFYVYDADENQLFPLDEANVALYFGDRILLHAMSYAEEASTPALLFDWQGNVVTGFIDVTDLRLSGDTLYMLRFYEPIELHAVSAKKLANAPGPDLTSEKLCEFGPYYGMFEGDDTLVIQPLAGGYPVTCKLADAAETVNDLLRNQTPTQGKAIEESCDWFSVSLPGSWEGRYICERDSDSLAFRYKTSPADNEGIFLFMINVSEGPDDLENPGFGGEGIFYEVAKIEKNNNAWYLMVSEPDAYYGVPDELYDDYMEMAAFTESLGRSITGKNGYTVTVTDYSDLLGLYAGTDDYGARYILHLQYARYNIVTGTLECALHADTAIIEDVSIRMFSNAGPLMWYRENAFGDWDFGSGVFFIEGRDGYSLMLRSEDLPLADTNGEYVAMQRTR